MSTVIYYCSHMLEGLKIVILDHEILFKIK